VKSNSETELYAVQQERSHNVTSSILVGCAVIIVDTGWFWEFLSRSANGVPEISASDNEKNKMT